MIDENRRALRGNSFYEAHNRSRIICMRVANFKIFRKETTIGPFEDFSAILGANGSGKSTILDAFSFCLLKDTIVDTKRYDYPTLAGKSTAKKQVPVSVFIRVETDTSALELGRQLTPENQSMFLVNDREVSVEEYQETLEGHSLFGFSVMCQDELTVFTSKTPKELMRLFEKISGSERFRPSFEKLLKEIDQLHTDVVDKTEQLRTCKKERKFASSLIEGSEVAHDLFQKLERAEKDFFEFSLMDFHKEMETATGEIGRINDELVEKHKALDAKSSLIMKQTSDIASKNTLKNLEEKRVRKIEILRDKEGAKKRVKAAEKRLAELASEHQGAELAVGKARTQLESHQARSKELEDQAQTVQAEIDKLGDHKNSKYAKMGASVKNLDELMKNLGKLEAEKEGFQSSLKTAVGEFETAQFRHNRVATQCQEAERLLDAEVAEMKRLGDERRGIEAGLAELETQKLRTEKRKSVLAAERQQKINMEAELDVLRIRLNQLTLEAQHTREEAPLANALSSVVEGVYGELSELVHVSNPKFAVAVGMALLPVLDSVVVPDQKTADKVSEFLKSKQQFKQVVILDSPLLTEEATGAKLAHLRALIGPRGLVAADAVTTNKNIPRLKEFIAHYLEGTVIADNLKTAFQLQKTFAGGVRRVVTSDGVRIKGADIDDPGSRKNYPKKLRNFLLGYEGLDEKEMRNRRKTQNIEDLLRDKQEVQNRVEELERQLKAARFKQLDEVQASEDSERQEKQTRNDLATVKSAIEVASHRMAVAQNRLDEVRDDFANTEKLLDVAATEMKRFKEKLKAIEDKETQAKKECLGRNKGLLKSAEDLDNVIAASKNNERENLRANSRLNELRIQMSLVPLEGAKKEVRMAEEAVKLRAKSELEQREEKSKAEKQSDAWDLELAAVVGEIQALENNFKEQEKEMASFGRQIKLLEAEIETLKGSKKEAYDLRERLRFNRLTFVEDTELKGMVIDESLRQIMNRKRSSGKDSEADRLSRHADEDFDFAYDFSKVSRSVDKESERDFTSEEVKKLVLESMKKRDDIKSKLRDMTTQVQNAEVIASEREKIARLATEIDRLQREIAEALTRQKEASEEFDSLAEKRKTTLMGLVDLMQARVGLIFKMFCMDERAAAGFLLENTCNPYLDGIIFNATPPAKKFAIGTDGLSSGEASMANLALFLCFNDCKRSSIVFFDEIDAHMDAENVFRLVNTLGKISRLVQVVVVSHKSFLHTQAQVLLGVTRHASKDSSTCLSHRFCSKRIPEQEANAAPAG